VDLAENAEPDSARVAACVAVVANATKLSEAESMQAEINEIRAQLASTPGAQNHRRS
jgi:hypothetical protein